MVHAKPPAPEEGPAANERRDGPEDPDAPADAQEARYGPLGLLRLRKADGRALIVYSRQPERQ